MLGNILTVGKYVVILFILIGVGFFSNKFNFSIDYFVFYLDFSSSLIFFSVFFLSFQAAQPYYQVPGVFFRFRIFRLCQVKV